MTTPLTDRQAAIVAPFWLKRTRHLTLAQDAEAALAAIAQAFNVDGGAVTLTCDADGQFHMSTGD